MHSCTCMNPVAETDLLADLTPHVEALRPVPLALIAVRRAYITRARAFRSPRAIHVMIRKQQPREALNWRFEPDAFVDCIGNQRGIIPHDVPLVRVLPNSRSKLLVAKMVVSRLEPR